MKAREPKLKRVLSDTEIDVCQWIRERCANYAEAAEFFNVSEPTVKRWMCGTCSPSPTAAVAAALYDRLEAVA